MPLKKLAQNLPLITPAYIPLAKVHSQSSHHWDRKYCLPKWKGSEYLLCSSPYYLIYLLIYIIMKGSCVLHDVCLRFLFSQDGLFTENLHMSASINVYILLALRRTNYYLCFLSCDLEPHTYLKFYKAIRKLNFYNYYNFFRPRFSIYYL